MIAKIANYAESPFPKLFLYQSPFPKVFLRSKIKASPSNTHKELLRLFLFFMSTPLTIFI